MTRFYRFAQRFLAPIFFLLFPTRYIGKENIPQGSAVICANHSNGIDPILVGLAVGGGEPLHFMAKIELMGIPFVGRLIRNLGAYAIDRGGSGIAAIRESMKFIKQGEKVLMFPEGTRVKQDEQIAAKSGAVRIAAMTNAPILPVHISRDKKIFRRSFVVIGEPYYINVGAGKKSKADYAAMADEMMSRIYELEARAV